MMEKEFDDLLDE